MIITSKRDVWDTDTHYKGKRIMVQAEPGNMGMCLSCWV